MICSSCAIIGYKPTQFKFKYSEKHRSCKRIKESLRDQIVFLHGRGVCKFYIGGSLGVDYEKRKVMRSEVLYAAQEDSR